MLVILSERSEWGAPPLRQAVISVHILLFHTLLLRFSSYFPPQLFSTFGRFLHPSGMYTLTIGVVLGATAAFLMPPVAARETKSAPKGI